MIETGTKIGLLTIVGKRTVTSQTEVRLLKLVTIEGHPKVEYEYLCVCSCGKKCIRSRRQLLHAKQYGQLISCGCYVQEQRRRLGHSFRKMFK